VALLLWLLPIRDAFQPGGDEGCELLKSFLFSSDFVLYREMWNDQPPLHTLILSAVFRVVGPSLPAARVLAIGFGGLLLYSLMSVVWIRCGRCAALAAGAILATAPLLLNLSFSVMLEVPAFATAMLAVWLLFRWLEERRPIWLVLSGVAMGCALQIKFTAALVLPALASEVFVNGATGVRRERFVDTIRPMLVWLGALAFTFVAIAAISGESLGTMWISHTHVVSTARQETTGPSGPRLNLSDLTDHLETVAPAVLGLLAIMWRRRWRQMCFALVFLATSLTTHLLHRPYWYYYYLHFIIPMAWLGGYGLSESVCAVRAAIGSGIAKARPMVLWFGWLGICAGVILVLDGGPRARRELDSLAILPRVGSDAVLRKLCENARATRWLYSDEYVYAFLARLRVPPELVVLPLKRFWSGQLDGERVLSCVRRYQPEQVLLSGGSKMSPEWERTDGTNYSVVCEDGPYRLFVAKRIATSAVERGERSKLTEH
jgi:4-amino-4-deoxy-L-arabinose transferase-like glycosyltransferase